MSLAYMAGKHQQIEWLGGSVMELLLDAEATEGKLFMARSRLIAGDASPVHLHTKEDEIFLLLGGSAVFWFGDERFDVEAGGVVYLPRDVPHAYRITADADMITICTPAGAENFFRAAGHDVATPKPPDWALTPASLAAAAAAIGMQIVGPPPPPD
jgi:mannose-6-phosphate isomerase-like protein (cupin superfamily)